MSEKPEIGSIGWVDLTVAEAPEIRNFYRDVVGWTATNLSMGDYDDFCLNQPGDGKTVAGICHARGGNADLPALWLMYIVVADLDHSIDRCTALGGEVIAGPKSMGKARYCVIKDPAGAVAALYQSGES